MALNLREVIELTAPQYLLISIFSPIAAFMILNAQLPTASLIPGIAALSLAVLGFNTSNMIFDAKLDALTKPKRPIPSGRTSSNEAWILAITCYGLSIITSITVNLQLTLIILIFIALSLIYSAPPIRLRNYWWGSSITGAALYGIIPFLTAGTVFNNFLTKPIFLIFFAILLIVISNTKDFEDTTAEKKLGISSLSTIFGEENGAFLVIYANFAILVIMAILAIKNIVSSVYLIATGISLFILIIASITFMKDIKEIKARNYIVEKIKEVNEFNETLQSDAVTISVVYAILVEIIFGIFTVKTLIP